MLSTSAIGLMAVNANTNTTRFVTGLKSRNEEIRIRTAIELQRYVTTELREASVEDLSNFLESFNYHIKEMVSSNEVNDNKGGIYAIMSLLDVDVGQTGERISRFANYLDTLFNSPDVGVLELASKGVGRLYLASGTYATDFVEGLVKKSFEWIQEDRTDSRRHAAVLVLRELAISVPTFFFQQIQQFFEVIFDAVKDSKSAIREGAAAAIRVALAITAQRETNELQQPQWYKTCLNEVFSMFDDPLPHAREKSLPKDDRIHGSLLVLNELMRCSNNEWERLSLDLRHLTHYHMPPSKKKERGPSMVKRLRGQVTILGPASLHLRDLLSTLPSTEGMVMDDSIFEQPYESKNCKELLLQKYDSICHLVLTQKNSRSPHIQSTLLTLLPRLAALDKAKFSESFLIPSLNYLITSIKSREKDRQGNFVCLGLVCVAIGTPINKHIPTILNVCKSSLPNKETPSKKKGVDSSVCICISLVAKAVGPAIYLDVQSLLESMMASGLSMPLTVALQSLSADIPRLKRDIAEGLLRILSQILIQRGASVVYKAGMTPPTPSTSSPIHYNNSNTVLALKTLGSFDFEGTGQSLMQFVKHICDNYLTSNQKEIRLEAVPTCLHLLRPFFASQVKRPLCHLSQQPHSLFTIVSKVLWVCVTDTDSDVRLCVLTSFDETFDCHLAQPDNFHSLIYALNDETFEVREYAVCILGRLASINPSYIHPVLRKLLMKILDELEYSGTGRNRELSARILGHLIASAPRFMRQFVEAIMTILVPKLKDQDPNPAVIMCILTAIGDLAQVSGSDMRKWLGDLLPFLLEMLGDGTSGWKRQIALITLGQLVENTGYVVHPYTQYPALLDILLSFLKTEQQPNVRRETLRVLGLLGALDPYKHKMNIGEIKISQDTGVALICMTENKNEDTSEMTTSEMLVNLNYSSLEEFYPACAIAVLMKVIKDPTLTKHQNDVVRAVTFIFMSLGVKGVPYLPRVIPSLLHVIRTSDASFRDYLFQKLSAIINIVKQHIRNYLDDIVAVLKEYWLGLDKGENATTIITVVESIAMAVGTEFKVHLKDLIPIIVRTFINDSNKEKIVSKRLLQALQKFGKTIEAYLHMILPHIVKLFDASEVPLSVRKTAIETVDQFTEYLDLTDFSSLIIHPLLRTIESTPDLRNPAMCLLYSLAFQLGEPYDKFIPVVQKILNKHKIVNAKYDILVAKIIQELPLTDEEKDIVPGSSQPKYESSSNNPVPIKKGTVTLNVESLRKAWSFKRLVSKDDWLEWLRRLSIELMKSSPSPALKACSPVATTYVQLTRDLFNPAFVSCWSELNESLQDDLLQSLKQALTSQDIPEITQTLLNLAEFMEHCDKGLLPLELQLLGGKAIVCRAYAKALHYKEEEFHKGPTSQVLQSLISINTQLGQTEAAAGLLEFSRKNNWSDMMVQEKWFEKLHDWEKALQVYDEKLKTNEEDAELALGQMRCLEALGEWQELYSVSQERCNTMSSLEDDCRRQMSRLSAAAAWAMGQWDTMDKCTNFISRETQEGAFYRAVLAIHKNEFQQAQELIELSRDLLDADLTAMVGESYQRAYNSMVLVQMLAELEEVIQFKLVPERRKAIAQIWWDRLQGCQRIVEDWQRILQVRSLVLSPQEDMRAWLKFASMCRKSGRLGLTQKTLVNLLGFDPSKKPDHLLPASPPHVTYQYCKYLYTCPSKRLDAFKQLQGFLNQLPSVFPETGNQNGPGTLQKLVSRVYLKLGLWHQELNGLNEKNVATILYFLEQAKETDVNCYKAWHAFACTNFEALHLYRPSEENVNGVAASEELIDASYLSDSNSGIMTPIEDETSSKDQRTSVTDFAISACKGFARSIALSDTNHTLQDTLRLLTVCFEYGHLPGVHQVLCNRLKTIKIDNWLQVIPQLIARIDTPRPLVNRLIHQLLVNVGKQHPQALLYPLTVAAKSSEPSRVTAADIVLKNMREHSNELVNQAMIISEELIRVAILWHEKWYEGLEEASRLYFGEQNVAAMFRVLRPLHTLLEKGPITLKEMSFNQAYGRDLMEAADWCREYQKTRNVRDLNQAWDLYYQVFRRISKQLPHLTSLDLGSVSPRLQACKDLDIAVPGSYSPNQPVNRISWIQSNIQVLTSKQKPRKLFIRGSDGHDYVFILKGHEDLRQDERVMQLFGLVNTLLVSNPETFRRNLTIQRYAVIPLSTNSGLIGWVPNCDTLHVLIRDWREKKKILLTMEHRLMMRMAPDLEHLMLMQKVEVFEHALASTTGDDLAKLFWFKSPSSEIWFDRRTNYTRSLAVMSMVGYVLGLGDRHPSNLMLHQLSGKFVHIDFGDCFEVAMARDKFPERIPFRLTRMLINAMEVTGIEGTYRMTCESVMDLLRKNKDSLMAMLEAFIYDPLLNWRLLEKDRRGTRSADEDEDDMAEELEPLSRHSNSHLDSHQPNRGDCAEGPPQSQNGIPANDRVSARDKRASEAANKKAVVIVNRVKDKLTGKDFTSDETLDVSKQVERLIDQATSHENLCQCYVGWCPFW